MKKILLSLAMIAMVSAIAIGATRAYFSDSETSEKNTFTAGTLDLKVGGQDDPNVAKFTVSNLKPGTGFNAGEYVWKVKNTGSLPGLLWFEVSPMINYENGQNEPEASVDTTSGEFEGELGDKLIVGKLNIYGGGTGSERLFIGSTTGPEFKHGIYNLNYMGGKSLYPLAGTGREILEPGEEQVFNLILKLPETVGNEVQSDGVEFDIVFHLDQVTP